MNKLFLISKSILYDFLFFIRFIFVAKIKRYKASWPEDLSICISTNKNNWKKSSPALIRSLKIANVPLQKIFVFEGGHNTNEKIENLDYNHYRVNHNSFDLTALISVLELNLNSPYWFLLHDTIEILPNFINQILSTHYKKFDTVQIKDYPSMNIGLYKHDFLGEKCHVILEEKNLNYSEEGLQLAKSRAVKLEDKLFKLSTKSHVYSRTNISTQVKRNINYHGQKRIREIYLNSGIIKYKANYQIADVYHINI